MNLWKCFGLFSVAFLVVAVWAFQTYWLYIPRLIDHFQNPISPATNVVWESGLKPGGDSGARPNIVLIVADDLGFNGLSY